MAPLEIYSSDGIWREIIQNVKNEVIPRTPKNDFVLYYFYYMTI